MYIKKAIIKLLPGFVRDRLARSNPIVKRYAMDGFLVASAVYFASTNNNLFALRLGASEYQLSLVMFLPQMLNMLILIPAGLFTGSLHNKRRLVISALIAGAFGNLLCSVSPFFGSQPIYFFLGFLSLTAGSIALFNVSWQSFFPDVVDISARNRVLTRRTQMDLFVSIPVPLLVGILLTHIASTGGKIMVHQSFYFFAAVFLVFAAINYRRIEAVRPSAPKQISWHEIKNATRSLLKNKPYLLFTGAALLLYMTWHFDWTLYFIGQVTYLKMSDFQVMLTTLGSTGIQFLTMRFWSRKNEKHGVVLPVTFGILGLSINPLVMYGTLGMPAPTGSYVFLILHALATLPIATITLNIFQCLLQVVDEEYRSFSISVYTSLVCLSNAVMPVAGVALYRALGGDRNALRYFFVILFALRIIAAVIWFLRWRRMQSIRLTLPIEQKPIRSKITSL